MFKRKIEWPFFLQLVTNGWKREKVIQLSRQQRISSFFLNTPNQFYFKVRTLYYMKLTFARTFCMIYAKENFKIVNNL